MDLNLSPWNDAANFRKKGQTVRPYPVYRSSEKNAGKLQRMGC